MIEESGAVIAFWVLAVAAVACSLMVALARNLFHAVLFLVLTFIALAGLYVVLSADFVAMAQILIYAGALSVLIVFAIMLTARSARDNADGGYAAAAFITVGLLFVAALFVILRTDWPTEPREIDRTAAAIGSTLIDVYVLPFEIASVVLTAAMVGALLLVREEKRRA